MLLPLTTLELITTIATSNSHLIFCFCNIIIVVLLVANNTSSSSSSVGRHHQGSGENIDYYSPPSATAHTETEPADAGKETEGASSVCVLGILMMDQDSASCCDLGDDLHHSYSSPSIESSSCFSVYEQDCSRAIEQNTPSCHQGDDQSPERCIPAYLGKPQDFSEGLEQDLGKPQDISDEGLEQDLPGSSSLQDVIRAPSATTTQGCSDGEEEEIVVEEEAIEEEQGQDDELRRRIEQFIDKMNRGWQYEKLRTAAVC